MRSFARGRVLKSSWVLRSSCFPAAVPGRCRRRRPGPRRGSAHRDARLRRRRSDGRGPGRDARAGASDVGGRSDREVTVSWASLAPSRNPRTCSVAGRQVEVPGRSAHLHRRPERGDGVDLSRPTDPLQPGATYEYAVTADNSSPARRAVHGQLHHRPAGPAAVPLHELRRPGHAEHRVGPFVRPVGLCGRPGGGAAAAVPPAQRRPVLRQPQPDVPARGLEGFRQQQPDGRRPFGPGCRARATTSSSSTTVRRA